MFWADRIRIGGLPIDRISQQAALSAIEAIVEARHGGAIFTPNVDHIVEFQDNPRLREAYEAATLSLADGMPVVWASRLLGRPLPEKVSGSDVVQPLAKRAAAHRWRLFLLGGAAGVAERAKARLEQLYPDIRVVGTASPHIDMRESAERRADVRDLVMRAAPDLVFVGLGAPKQELWIHESREALRPAVLLGVGASLDFLAGARRAPAWLSQAGFEWLYRLAHEPRRLWRRYLVRDPRFLRVLLDDARHALSGREHPLEVGTS